MRLMTWNCRVGGFRWKAERIAPYRPDVLVVPEVTSLDIGSPFEGGEPTFRDRVARPEWPRGIGVFSYTDTVLRRAVDDEDLYHGFVPYTAQHRGRSFQVVAVWTYGTGKRATSYRQAHEGLRRYADLIRRAPTVVLGDFNIDAAYRGGGEWRDLAALLEPLGLVSAYHHVRGELPGRETQSTHVQAGGRTAPLHLDYCFVPRAWVARVTKVEVGRHEDWRDLSDHVPVTVDLDLDGA